MFARMVLLHVELATRCFSKPALSLDYTSTTHLAISSSSSSSSSIRSVLFVAVKMRIVLLGRSLLSGSRRRIGLALVRPLTNTLPWDQG